MPVERDRNGLTPFIWRNMAILRRRHACEQQSISREGKIADAMTRFSASMKFVSLHVARVLLWSVWNIKVILQLKPIGPTFVILASAASVEAIFCRLCADEPEPQRK